MQSGADAECRAFQEVAAHGHESAWYGSRQGIYAVAPSGAFLGWCNAQSAEPLLDLMARAQARFAALPPIARRPGLGHLPWPEHRAEQRFPHGGLVLAVTVRDLTGARRTDWNQDHAWFSRVEARSFLPADPTPGDVHDVPEELALRLARFHLLDAAHGQTDAFTRRDVERAQLAVEVVRRDGARVSLLLSGGTRAAGNEPARALKTRIAGSADFDLESGAFTRFELVAFGTRSGATEFNGRAHDLAPSAIGFVLEQVEVDPANAVAPAFSAYYDGDWLQQ